MKDALPMVPPEADASAATVSEARLESVLDTAPDGIIVIDAQARILVFNKACEQMFGYEAGQVMGKNISMLMPPEHSDTHDRYVEAYKNTGERKIIGIGREVRARRKDGTFFPIDLSVGEAATPDGRQFIGILRDITKRKETEARLRDVQAELIRITRVSALDEMGSALAHEINQPLTAIMLYLQAVSRELTGLFPDGAARPLKVIDKACREAARAGAIIQRVRQMIEKRAPDMRPNDLNVMVMEAVELCFLGADRGVSLKRNLAHPSPVVMADSIQIQQIVVNLLRNALEAVREQDKPEVDITTREEGDWAILTICDNGPGVPSDKVPELFQAFATGRRHGVGLGLAISRTIAQNHGGDLNLDSPQARAGASFTLRLPLHGDE